MQHFLTLNQYKRTQIMKKKAAPERQPFSIFSESVITTDSEPSVCWHQLQPWVSAIPSAHHRLEYP